MNDILFVYDNGNTKVTLLSDGTKIREIPDNEPVSLNHMESMDVKITDNCLPTSDNPICAFCHEKSGPNGKHADLNKLYNVLSSIPSGVEIAIGGGNPLSHPDLVDFLRKVKAKGLVVNLTVNQKHLKDDGQLLIDLISERLIWGVGISYSDKKYLPDIEKIINASDNVVFHTIMGINDVDDVELLYKFCQERGKVAKVLVLGYKNYGFGINYYLKNPDIEANKYRWYTRLASYFKRSQLVISFDNLSIFQLNLRRFFTTDAWNKFYMGAEGKYTLFIDAVEQKYASSSTSDNRKSFDECSLTDFFRLCTF